jgi:hypothetical protein
VVSLLIFALGAGFSIYEGVSRFLNPVPIQSPVVSYVVLASAFLFEGGSWLFSLKQFRRAKGSLGFFKAFRLSNDPPSFMTLFEDSVALLGILIAAAATVAAVALRHPELDGAGSIAIGLILAATSIFLARESKSFLIGEQAYPSIRESILAIADAQPTCLRANGLFTVQLGPSQVVAMLDIRRWRPPTASADVSAAGSIATSRRLGGHAQSSEFPRCCVRSKRVHQCFAPSHKVRLDLVEQGRACAVGRMRHHLSAPALSFGIEFGRQGHTYPTRREAARPEEILPRRLKIASDARRDSSCRA